MSVTLTYGFKNPENGDRGSSWFADLNANIVQLNSHNHDGSNSAPIPSSTITGGIVNILAAAWVLDVAGRYKQDVTTPSGYNMDTSNPLTRLTVSGNLVTPTIEKLSGTSFRIYTCDNSLAYTVVFR